MSKFPINLVARLSVAVVLTFSIASPSWAGTLYVNAGNGNDAASGQAANTAFKTIQKACEVVTPGDTVIVAEGVYFGPIELRRAGTTEAPITFKADALAKNRVVVTNADPIIRAGNVKWTHEDAALQLYSVPFDHMPVRGLYDDVDLLPYPTLEGLKTFMISERMPGPHHGFAFDAAAKKLYVRLHPSGQYGVADPNQHRMSFAPPAGRGDKGEHLEQARNYAWGVRAPGSAHVVLDGFTFESTGVAAVYARASDVTVRNCWFFGCRFAVAGGPTSDNDRWQSDNVTIERCYYTQFPAFRDLQETLQEYNTAERRATVTKFFWFGRKGTDGAIPDAYEYEAGLALGIGDNWTIRNNHVFECFDGLSQLGMSGAKNTVISQNRFERIVDNAIETENHAANVRIEGNEIIDAFMPISWQPLGGTPWPGPVFVFNNVIYNTPQTTALWRGVDYPEAAFKIGAHDNNWKSYNKHMMDVPKDAVAVPGAGFLVYNNTVVMPGAHFLERTNGTASRKLNNFQFFNNIFITDAQMNKSVPLAADTGLSFDYNLFVENDANKAAGSVLAGMHGLLAADIGFVDREHGDFSLKPGSPALGAGTTRPEAPQSSRDIGAATWQRPSVGPK